MRTFKGGQVLIPGLAAIECIVRNLTDTGACIEMKNAPAVANKFVLLVKPELRRHNCEVIWREGARLGLRFV